MSLSYGLEELLDYSDHEREKWRGWFGADPGRLAITLQPGGRFPTAGSLLDHTFLIERRHLSRLSGATPPDSTGIAPGDADALFEYAELVRADLRRYLKDLDDQRGAETISFTVQAGPVTMTRRKLALHIVMHEVRHLAQIALAARTAGLDPPGEHDYFYYPGA